MAALYIWAGATGRIVYRSQLDEVKAAGAQQLAKAEALAALFQKNSERWESMTLRLLDVAKKVTKPEAVE